MKLRLLQKWLLLFLTLLITGLSPAWAQETPPALEEIRRLETMLLVPCTEPLSQMNELVRLGKEYQEQERLRLALYRRMLDVHRLALNPFITTADTNSGADVGLFRARYDQLRQQAIDQGVLQEATYENIPDGYSLPDVASAIEENSDYSKRGELARKLFFTKEQRPSAEKLRQEMLQLKTDWIADRAAYYEQMKGDGPFKDGYAELNKRASDMTGKLRPEFDKNREALRALAASGSYEHCLGMLTASSTYTIKSDSSDIQPYLSGSPGTFEALPGVGFRLALPTPVERIKAAEIPENFPLALAIKFDAQLHMKTEIERLQIQIKGERDAIIAMGTRLTFGALDGTAGRFVGETFNVFTGVVEGFAGVGNIIIGLGNATIHPVDAANKIAAIGSSIGSSLKNLYESPEAQRELTAKVMTSTFDFFRGIGAGVELLAERPKDKPADKIDYVEEYQRWQEKAENTRLARQTLTGTEKFVGNILADLATAGISRYAKGASAAAKLAGEAADTAADLSQAAAKAKKLEEAAARMGKLADDVPGTKTLDKIGEQIVKREDELKKIIDDIAAPKPREIPFNQSMVPTPEEVLAQANATTARGGMNAYFKLNDDLGIKVGHKEILKKAGETSADISRAARDVDAAGRSFLA